MNVESALGGLCAGLLAGTFGVGGGSVTIPILIFFLHLDPVHAVATNLLIVSITSMLSLLFHTIQGTARKKGIVMGMFGIIGATIGNYIFFNIDPSTLYSVLGIAFILISILILVEREGSGSAELPHLMIVGLIMGLYSGIVGKGGGSIAVPLLVTLFNVEIKDAIGSTVSATPIVASSSLLPKAIKGLIVWDVALAFIPFMILGTYVGSKIMKSSSSRFLRRAYSLFMLVIGLKFLGLF